MSESFRLEILQLIQDAGVHGHPVSPVNLTGNRLDLLKKRHFIRINRLVISFPAVKHLDDLLRNFLGPGTAIGPMGADISRHTLRLAVLLDHLQLGFRIRMEPVDPHDRWHPELLNIRDVLIEIRQSFFQSIQILRKTVCSTVQVHRTAPQRLPPTHQCLTHTTRHKLPHTRRLGEGRAGADVLQQQLQKQLQRRAPTTA